MSNSNTKDETRVITPEAIISYPHLDKPQPSNDGKPPKYSAAFVFLKGSDLAKLKAAAIAAGVKKFGANIKLPNGQSITFEQALAEGIFKSPFRKDGLMKGYPEGSIFITARTAQAPQVVYGDLKQVPLDQIKTAIYPGAKVRASLTAFGYDNSGNKGVSFALNSVQKIGDGDRLDNRVAAENEFTAELSQAPADLDSLLS